MSTFDFDFDSPSVPVLVELMGRERIAGRAWACPAGGWYVQAYASKREHVASAPFYVGPCAVFRMTEVDEEIACATAESLPPVLPPSWMVAPKPSPAPRPAPPPFVAPRITVGIIGCDVKLRDRGDEWFSVVDVGDRAVYLSGGVKVPVDRWAADVMAFNDIPF